MILCAVRKIIEVSWFLAEVEFSRADHISFRSLRLLPHIRAGALALSALACGGVVLACPSAPQGSVSSFTTVRCIEVRSESDNQEFRLQLRARSPDSSWEVEGREAGALGLFIDDSYDQHIFLVRGSEEAVYELVVGPLANGSHSLCFKWDRSWAPGLETQPQIVDVQVAALDRSSAEHEQILHAPILYLRADTIGRFSDVPLLLYWDEEREAGQPWVVYTVILSNEDGGTNTQRLMARWGRTTDIEWCYAYANQDNRLPGRYQGRDHETLPFKGGYQGRHPLLYDVTKNNNFSDAPVGNALTRVRLVPFHADLQGRARETVMDRFPWTYEIMAMEMIRERRLEPVSDPLTAQVSDLRNYAYIDFCAEQAGTTLSAEVRLRGSSSWYHSDHGDPEAEIGRSGCVRTTVELPPGVRPADLDALRIRCGRAPVEEGKPPSRDPAARLASVPQVFLLDHRYRPGPNLLSRDIRLTLRPGATATLKFSRIPKAGAVNPP